MLRIGDEKMNKQRAKLNAFYQAVRDLQGKIDAINRDNHIPEKHDTLKREMRTFADNIRDINPDSIKQNKSFSEVLKAALLSIKDNFKVWDQQLAKHLEDEAFRAQLEDRFIVMIYGKVKAGKSTLANFIAGQRLDQQQVLFKQVENGQLCESKAQQFATDNLECTQNIQLFELDALALVDTPGLFSTTDKNHQLAKAYIQNADYIIFPTSSEAPLQRDETDQIEELVKQGKAVNICITQSDLAYDDEEEGKLVKKIANKSAENRQAQQQWVKDELKATIGEDLAIGDILSISVLMAEQGLKAKDQDLFAGSHIPNFYQLLTKVITEKAAKFKQDAPKKRFNSLVNGVNEKCRQLKEQQILALKNNIKDIKDKAAGIKQDLQTDIDIIIASERDQHLNRVDINNAQAIFDEIDNKLNTEFESMINEAIAEILQDFAGALDHLSLASGSTFAVSKKTKTIRESYTTQSLPGKVIKFASFGIFSDVGKETHTTSRTVDLGDDAKEQLRAFLQNRKQGYKKQLDRVFSGDLAQFFKQVDGIVYDIEQQIDTFIQNILQINI